MVCPPCSAAAVTGQPHYGCVNAAGAGTNWCDCQHMPGAAWRAPVFPADRVPPADPAHCPESSPAATAK